ncbi:MAG: hypothetical protein QM753_17645 [Thermomicrobiales bacterium]
MMADILLLAGAFLASAVEMVEALTLVFAMGVTRGWKSSLIGAAAALVLLGITIAIFGPLIADLPLAPLRIVIGGLLAIFGLQWLRKAILRASGYKALHDEDAIFAREVAESRAAGHDVRVGMDWYAFTVSFKGVFLEGLEVAFIVLTFGSSHGSIPLAATGAVLGLLTVAAVGVVVRAPLSRVPENTMKFAVGVMLTGFGVFWAGEGIGIAWPGETAMLLAILIGTLVVAWGMVVVLRQARPSPFAADARH